MIHSKELSERNYSLIAEQFPYKFDDVSYINDCCDSLYCDDADLLIMLPNSEVSDESQELFTTFVLNINDQEINGEKITLVFDNIDELISEIEYRL